MHATMNLNNVNNYVLDSLAGGKARRVNMAVFAMLGGGGAGGNGGPDRGGHGAGAGEWKIGAITRDPQTGRFPWLNLRVGFGGGQIRYPGGANSDLDGVETSVRIDRNEGERRDEYALTIGDQFSPGGSRGTDNTHSGSGSNGGAGDNTAATGRIMYTSTRFNGNSLIANRHKEVSLDRFLGGTNNGGHARGPGAGGGGLPTGERNTQWSGGAGGIGMIKMWFLSLPQQIYDNL